MRAIVLVAVLFALCGVIFGDEHSFKYTDKEDLILWVNKVGPYHNPQETYSYYILPYCKGNDVVEHRHENLGEALLGYELVNSGIGMKFRENVQPKEICSVSIDKVAAAKFQYAVLNHYWYQMYLDDLPIWGMVGEVIDSPDAAPGTAYIYTHKRFTFAANGNQIIEVNLTSENPKPIEAGAKLVFTYSVTWTETTTPFEDRFNKYLDYNFFEHQIHWFSIFNSFMMVIFLVGLVAMILMRTLRRDYAKYAKDDVEDERADIGDESGWKQVHGDVFRPPPRLLLFSALVGTGFQLLVLGFFVIMFAIVGTLYISRGTLMTVFIFCYAITSFAGGFYGGGLYKQNKGTKWIQSLVLTAVLLPGVCSIIGFALNFIAISYQSLAAIPFGTMVIVLLIWLFIALPLTLLGALVGKHLNGEMNAPCRVKPVPRAIPEKKWYMEPSVVIALGGILPFGSIFIEMYFIFTSFWHYKFYYVYGFMLLVYSILIMVSVCVTIVSTYFILNAEDYRWQWMSFLSSASTAAYVYLYAVYYFVVKTRMSGFFQTCFYFGYMAMFCIILAIMCGTIGYIGASLFVHRIYRNIKVD